MPKRLAQYDAELLVNLITELIDYKIKDANDNSDDPGSTGYAIEISNTRQELKYVLEKILDES